MAVDIGGAAIGVGTQTAASGEIHNTIYDTPLFSIAYGSADFDAAAASSCGQPVGAAADTYLNVTGADIVISYQTNAMVQGPGFATASSDLNYIAIDLHGFNLPGGPINLALSQDLNINFGNSPALAHLFGMPDLFQDGSGHMPFGIAAIGAEANAFGANTFTDTMTHALTVENHFSAVAGHALVAA